MRVTDHQLDAGNRGLEKNTTLLQAKSGLWVMSKIFCEKQSGCVSSFNFGAKKRHEES